MLPNETDQEPKTIKANEDNLQLYARANAPSRDYYGLTITGSFVSAKGDFAEVSPHSTFFGCFQDNFEHLASQLRSPCHAQTATLQS